MNRLKKIITQLPLLVWMLLLANFLFFTARFVAMPFMAIYFSEKLELNPAEVGVLIGISPLASMLFSVFGGRLADKFGVHRIYPFALIIPAISLIGYVLFTNYYIIALLSVLAGLGWSTFNSTNNALLSKYSPELYVEKVFSYNYWGVNLGGMLGPLVGVLMLDAGSSSLPILLFAIVLFILALAMSILFKKQINSTQVDANNDKGEIHAKESLLKQLFKSGVLVWMTISYFLLFFVESQQNSNIAQIFNVSFENGVKLFGTLISMNTAIIVIVQPIIAQFIDKINVKLIIIAGNALYIIGFLTLTFLNQFIWVWYFSFFLITLGELIVAPKIQGIISKSAPDHQKATYFSILQMGGNLAYGIGPWLGGLLLTFSSVVSLMMLLAVMSAVQLVTILLANKSYEKTVEVNYIESKSVGAP